jgi:eukaryotic-like serine/threonine-protein kinase
MGRPVDARSDIFSFGLVLYEMLSGRRAFDGETPMSIIAALLHKEPRPLKEVVPQTSRDLVTDTTDFRPSRVRSG